MALNLSSKIFLDGADPAESKKAKDLLGFLDGQTTNPTLLAKNPELREGINKGGKISEKELYSFYKKIIGEIGNFAAGPVSVEVYADKNTKAEEMVGQAREMADWGKDIYIKLPIIREGLKAAKALTEEGIGVNMTLCFSQEQAAAVWSATKGSKKPVFVSPFLGRLDDTGENGVGLVENIIKMFESGDGHVLTLAASVRNLNHLLFCLKINKFVPSPSAAKINKFVSSPSAAKINKFVSSPSAAKINCPLITVPMKIIEEWAKKKFVLPDENFEYAPDLKPIEYKNIDLNSDWRDYDISHSLTEAGIERFCADWKGLIA